MAFLVDKLAFLVGDEKRTELRKLEAQGAIELTRYLLGEPTLAEDIFEEPTG